MSLWSVYSTLALSCWGLWAFFPKLAIGHISPRSALVYEALGGTVVGVIVLLTVGRELEYSLRGIVPSVLTGVAGYLGLLFFLYAIQLGTVSVTASFTAIYPVITLLLAVVFLGERMSATQWLGVFLALVSIALISKG